MDDNIIESHLISIIAISSSFIILKEDEISTIDSCSSSSSESESESDEETESILYGIIMVGNTRGETTPYMSFLNLTFYFVLVQQTHYN